MTKEMNLVILPFKAKSWAFLLDYSYQELDSATLLDLSTLQSLRRVSKARRRFQDEVASSRNFLVRQLGSAKSFVFALFTSPIAFKQYRTGLRIYERRSRERLDDIIHCRLAAHLGDRNHDKINTPFMTFAKHFVVASRTLMELNEFFESQEKSFSKIIVFNGREPLEASCIRIALKFGVAVVIVEKGSSNSHFQVFKNSPHFHPDWWDLIQNFQLSDSESLDLAEERRLRYVESKLAGEDLYFHETWLAQEVVNSQTENFVDRDTVLYFTSSSSEFSPFSQYNYDVGYLDQYDAVCELADEVLSLGMKLAIRRHPNSVGIDGVDRERESWLNLVSKYPKDRVKYFDPTVLFDTYGNIKKCGLVFVWKSSIGFESLALGKPSFALASAKWSWDSRLRCWAGPEIRKALIEKAYPSIGKQVVFLYSNFMANSGTKCKTFANAEKWGITTISGTKIYNGTFERAFQYVQYRFPKIFGKRRKSVKMF